MDYVEPTLVTTDNSWTQVSYTELHSELDPNTTQCFEFSVMARRSNGDCGFWRRRVMLTVDGGMDMAQIGSVVDVVTPVKTLGAALWDVRLLATDPDPPTGGYYQVEVRGGSYDVAWHLEIQGKALGNP